MMFERAKLCRHSELVSLEVFQEHWKEVNFEEAILWIKQNESQEEGNGE